MAQRLPGACVPHAAIAVLVVCGVPLFAQSHTERLWDAEAVQADARTVADRGTVRAYRPERTVETAADIPDSITVSEMYRPLLESMLRRSPTFRRQCRRIAATHGLRIMLRPSQLPLGRLRARTRLLTTSEGLIAYVDLGGVGTDDPVELIAHELEHVIERLDGVDLRRLADLPRTSVRPCEGGAFETVRAHRTGLIVAQEVRGALD